MKNKLILYFSFISFIAGNQQQIYSQCVTCPGNIVTGINSSALGHGDTVTANYSFAAGRNSHISSTPGNISHYSNVIGSWSRVQNGGHANVIGSFSQALNDFAFVFGTYSKAKGSYSFALGTHVEAWSGSSFVIGEGMMGAKLINTIPNSLMIGIGSAFPTLFVEKAPYSSESNRTGRIGIGNVTSPQAKLHIRGDAQEDATLRLEATGFQKQSRIYFSDAHQITAANNTAMHFHSSEGNGYVFHDGDIYMHDIQSGIIMKSPNGQCWRGTLNDQGMLVFAPVACPEEGTIGSTVINSPTHDIMIYPNPASTVVIIETSRSYTDAVVSITGMDGRQHHRQSLTGNITRVNIENLIPETYLVVVEQNEVRLNTQRLIVQ